MFRIVLLGLLTQACTEYNVVKPADDEAPGEDPVPDTAEPPDNPDPDSPGDDPADDTGSPASP